MMQRTLNQLLKIQIIIILLMYLLTIISSTQSLAFSFLAGGFLCLLSTLVAKRIFNHAPRRMSGKDFFRTMIVIEVIKWLITLIVGMVLVKHVQPVGVVIGFALTYFSYFLMILKV